VFLLEPLAVTDSFAQNESASVEVRYIRNLLKMSNNEWTTVTPTKRYRPPYAREAPPAPARKPKREEEFPALVKGHRARSSATSLESRFNDLAREMQEERERQELADAEAARQRRRVAHIPFPWDMRSGQSRRFQRCDGLVILPTPMEYRDEDWDPAGSNAPSDEEHEQNTDIADTRNQHD